MSYGHGMSVNLMQLARAYQVFARDGDIVPLSLSRLDTPPVHGIGFFSPQTAREVRADARDGRAAGRHRAQAQRAGLPRRRQDRHRA
jgi:cell division protein FtsI (penicillin-binding protein 3)